MWGLMEKGTLLRTRFCVLRPPLTWASSPQAGRGRVFGELRMEGADVGFLAPLQGASVITRIWLDA